jgi:hypothetical protein
MGEPLSKSIDWLCFDGLDCIYVGEVDCDENVSKADSNLKSTKVLQNQIEMRNQIRSKFQMKFKIS